MNQPVYDWGYTECQPAMQAAGTCNTFNVTKPGTNDVYHESDPWGFVVRNCTSYAAWRANKEFGVNIPSDWGSANTWDTGAHDDGYKVSGLDPEKTGPEAGDIAQWDSTHVAFVDSVNPDGSVNVSEFNKDEHGNFTQRGEAYGTSKVDADHYIDVNGVGNRLSGSTGSNGGNTAPSTVAYNQIGEGGEVMSQERHAYTKVGGRLWWIKHMDQWTDADTKTWGEKPSATVSTEDVHNNEVGYPGPGDHPPGHGTAVYRQDEKQQYYFYGQNAYTITEGEVDDLNVRNKAQMIPNTMRLWDFTGKPLPMENGMIYRVAGDPTVRVANLRSYGWFGLHANNNAVLECIKITSGRSTINIVPQSARRTVEIHDSSVPVLCAFPPQIVVKTPEDLKQFRVTGNNQNEGYVLHPYPTPLLKYLHTNGSPDLRETRAIYGLYQGSAMAPPQGAFFRNMSNGQVFESIGGQYRYVSSKDMLVCLGNPPIIDVPANAMEGSMVQGPPMACATSASTPASTPDKPISAPGPESSTPPSAPAPSPEPAPQPAPAAGPESPPAAPPTPSATSPLPASESTPPSTSSPARGPELTPSSTPPSTSSPARGPELTSSPTPPSARTSEPTLTPASSPNSVSTSIPTSPAQSPAPSSELSPHPTSPSAAPAPSRESTPSSTSTPASGPELTPSPTPRSTPVRGPESAPPPASPPRSNSRPRSNQRPPSVPKSLPKPIPKLAPPNYKGKIACQSNRRQFPKTQKPAPVNRKSKLRACIVKPRGNQRSYSAIR
ncbi:CHAP domain-containing protein [Candidatus Saccharibacteria bacterium]|nr:CHAP domain-containing protein [Candidatus Saccharibacteria bacterium]